MEIVIRNLVMKVITARKRSLGQGNIFTPVCSQGGGVRGCSGGCAWLLGGGSVRGCSGGACVVALGGHAWLLLGGACVVAPEGHAGYSGGHGCSRGVCVVAPMGGMHGCSGGHVWLLPRGACMVALGRGGMCGIRRHTEIRSMSGRYTSYWNAFLLNNTMQIPSVLWNFVIEINCICTKKNGIYSLKLIRRKCYIFRQLVTCGRMQEYRIRLLSRWYHSGRRSKLPKLSRKRLHPARCLFRNRVWMLSRRRHSSSRTF